ncbi:hypothetical protein PMI29_03579 [Pseudomonas sp. GM49]|nr:hypothetical protein PMI29_03579 [Pseudomonas sp. GM49]
MGSKSSERPLIRTGIAPVSDWFNRTAGLYVHIRNGSYGIADIHEGLLSAISGSTVFALRSLDAANLATREEHLASEARLLADQLSTFHGTLRESTQRLSGLLAMASTQFSGLSQIFLGICRRCVAFKLAETFHQVYKNGTTPRKAAAMTPLKLFVALSALSAASHAMAWDYVLLDTDKAARNWQITSQQLGIKTDKPFSVTLRTLHGGRQEGVSIVDIDNGTMKLSVVPTRGMNVLQASVGNVRMGWDSPVKEVVNPSFIELNGRGGLGWLEGFNELVTRCGYEWVGHPGVDNGELLTLHGRAANIPANKVTLHIDEKPPYAITLHGELKEQAFKKVDFSVATELVTEPGSVVFALNDTLTNNGDYPKEYQALYHSNFSTPFLEQGARFAAPVKQVSPFNDKAKGDLPGWQTYRAPTKDYDETVYNVVPYADAKGDTLTVLHNKAGSLGVSVGFNTQTLPVFSLWKNTDTQGQGYVTGLEPGTSFSYNRRYQRPLNLVPTIGPKEHKQFRISYSLLADKAAVDKALKQVSEIQGGRETEVRQTPLVDLTKG